MANRENNKGGNSELRGKYWNCPDYVLNCLSNAVKTYESLKDLAVHLDIRVGTLQRRRDLGASKYP